MIFATARGHPTLSLLAPPGAGAKRRVWTGRGRGAVR